LHKYKKTFLTKR